MVSPYTDEDRLQLALDRGILVDDQDLWLLSSCTWYITSLGYAATRTPDQRTLTYLHHCIMGCPIWYLDEIDHINRYPRDNQRSNLRWATHSQNLINNDQAVGIVGVRGVTLNASGNYMAQVKRKGVYYYLGSFATKEQAMARREQWLQQYEDGIGNE